MSNTAAEMKARLEALKDAIQKSDDTARRDELHQERWDYLAQQAAVVPLDHNILTDALVSFYHLRSSQRPPDIAQLKSLLESFHTAAAQPTVKFYLIGFQDPLNMEEVRLPRQVRAAGQALLTQSDAWIAASFNALVGYVLATENYPSTQLFELLSVYVSYMSQRNLTLLTNTLAWDIFLTFAGTHSLQARTSALEILAKKKQGSKIRDIREFLRGIDIDLEFLFSATLYSPEEYTLQLLNDIERYLEHDPLSELNRFFMSIENSDDPQVIALVTFLLRSIEALQSLVPQALQEKIAQQQRNLESEIQEYEDSYLSQFFNEKFTQAQEGNPLPREDFSEILKGFYLRLGSGQSFTESESQFFKNQVLTPLLQDFGSVSDLEVILQTLPTCLRCLDDDELFEIFTSHYQAAQKGSPLYTVLGHVFQILDEHARVTQNLSQRLDRYARLLNLHILGFQAEQLDARLLKLVRAAAAKHPDPNMDELSLGLQQNTRAELQSVKTNTPEVFLQCLDRILKFCEKPEANAEKHHSDWILKQAIQVKAIHPQLKASKALETFLSERLNSIYGVCTQLCSAETTNEMGVILGYWQGETFPISTLCRLPGFNSQQVNQMLLESHKLSEALLDVTQQINSRFVADISPKVFNWLSFSMTLEGADAYLESFLQIAQALSNRIKTQTMSTSSSPEFVALMEILDFLKRNNFPQEKYQANLDEQLTLQSDLNSRYIQGHTATVAEADVDKMVTQLSRQLRDLIKRGADPNYINFKKLTWYLADPLTTELLANLLQEILIASKPHFPLAQAALSPEVMNTFVKHPGPTRRIIFDLLIEAGFSTESLFSVINDSPHEYYKDYCRDQLAKTVVQQIKLSETSKNPLYNARDPDTEKPEQIVEEDNKLGPSRK